MAEGGELRQGIDSWSLWLSIPGSANTAATENPRSGSVQNRHVVGSSYGQRLRFVMSIAHRQAMIHSVSPAGPRVVHVVAPVIKAALRQRPAMPVGIMVLRRRYFSAKVEDRLRRPGRNPRAFWIML